MNIFYKFITVVALCVSTSAPADANEIYQFKSWLIVENTHNDNLDDYVSARVFNGPIYMALECEDFTTSVLLSNEDNFFTQNIETILIDAWVDKNPTIDKEWFITYSAISLFDEAAIDFIKTLNGGDRLFTRIVDIRYYTGQYRWRHEAMFDLNGIEHVTQKIAKACNWSHKLDQ